MTISLTSIRDDVRVERLSDRRISVAVLSQIAFKTTGDRAVVPLPRRDGLLIPGAVYELHTGLAVTGTEVSRDMVQPTASTWKDHTPLVWHSAIKAGTNELVVYCQFISPVIFQPWLLEFEVTFPAAAAEPVDTGERVQDRDLRTTQTVVAPAVREEPQTTTEADTKRVADWLADAPEVPVEPSTEPSTVQPKAPTEVTISRPVVSIQLPGA